MPEPETLTVEFTMPSGQRRRVVYESRYPHRGYERREEERRGCQWRTVGSETIAEITVDADMPVAFLEEGP